MPLSWNEIKFKVVSGRKYFQLWNAFYFLTVVIGISFLVLEVGIYRKTIIDLSIPLIVILAIGTIAFFFNKSHYPKIYPLQGIFFRFLQNIISWGFISCYLLMAINYYFANKDFSIHKLAIKKKSSLPGGRGYRNETQPLIVIDYFGFDKELIFKFSQTEKVKRADTIILKTRKGLLGFDVLDSYDVIPK